MLLVWLRVGAHACVGMFMPVWVLSCTGMDGHVYVSVSGQHWVEFLKHVLCLT